MAEEVLCSIFKVPSATIDGMNDSDNKFIGLANLKSTLNNFLTEMENLTNVKNNLNTIKDDMVWRDTNRAWKKIENFVRKFSDKKTIDGMGLVSTPNTILKLTRGVNF